MQTAVRRQTFDCDYMRAVELKQELDAPVYRNVLEPLSRRPAGQHCARAAITLGTDYLCAHEPALESQVLGQCNKRGIAANNMLPAIQKKTNMIAHVVRCRSLLQSYCADSLPNKDEFRMLDVDALTDEVLSRCDALIAVSDDVGCLTRPFLSPSTQRAHELVSDWMRMAGLSVRRDALGNLIGRKLGRTEHVFALGSHIDTVPNAGKYDGVLGVLLGIAAMQALADRSFVRTVDVIAFSEEEGVRFRTPYLGSRGVCGRFDDDLLKLLDADGIALSQALRHFGLDPTSIPSAAYPPGQPVGYFEAHIEQGPVLESLRLPLGVVSAIIGQSRYRLEFIGQAGHAGTQPMELRRDALAGAAEFVSTVERVGRSTRGLRATVGSLTAAPGATNVIPGDVRLSLDVRHESDAVRRQIVEQLLSEARGIGTARKLAVIIESALDECAVPCDQAVSARLAAAVSAAGHTPHRIVSGAGHDAVVMATRCPVAMLFVRSPGGISHHPDEAVLRDDVRAALDVIIRFLAVELDLE
jgi:allantoate deiminase